MEENKIQNYLCEIENASYSNDWWTKILSYHVFWLENQQKCEEFEKMRENFDAEIQSFKKIKIRYHKLILMIMF